MARGRVSCGEIIVDLGAAKGKCWSNRWYRSWRKRTKRTMAKPGATRKPSSKTSRPAAPRSKNEGLKTGSLAPQTAASRSIAEAIGTQVRNLRRKLDLTGAELADQAG